MKYIAMRNRVARWFIFKPKTQIWVNFRGPLNGKCCYILWRFGIFYRHLGNFMTIRYNKCAFDTFFLILVSCTKKNLATLKRKRKREKERERERLREGAEEGKL
jgi:hypothetical protein